MHSLFNSRNNFILLLTFIFQFAFAQSTTLRFGKLITGNGEIISDAVVLIDSNRIVKISSGDNGITQKTKLIDLRPLTAIPGLIDVHTHLTFFWDKSPGTNPWRDADKLNPLVIVFLAQENARKTLEAGVTSIRDLGSWAGMDLAMKELINRGAMIGPRMFVAGNGLHVSRHPVDPLNYEADPGKAENINEVMKVVRQEIASGVDWIKIYASSGSDQDVTSFQQYTYEEMKIACDIAHQAGKRVAVHSYGPEAARDAMRAGAESIEHSTGLNKADFEEMLKLGTYYVPTIDHNRYYIDHRNEYGYGEVVVNNLQDYIKRNFESLKLAVKTKVKIAMGSDAVFTGFGENTRELEWFVKAGMTPLEALSSATKNAAELLGKEKELGTIASGFFADIVAVDGDPTKDINVVINGVKWVMKDGKVVINKIKE